MGMKIYSIAGIIIEAFIIRTYMKEKVRYTKAELLVGAAVDIIAWPIVLIGNVIRWSR